MIEDGRAGSRVGCGIGRYGAHGHYGDARTVAHNPRVPRHHLTAVLSRSPNSSPAPPRLGGRPLAMSKNLSTPHVTIC